MESPSVPSAGSCGTAAYLRQPVFTADILSDPKWVKYWDFATQAGLRAAWSSPILSNDGKVLGNFGMYDREVRSPTPCEIELIDHANRIAGIAIDRERSQVALETALEESKKSEGQLRQLVDAIPEFLVVLGPDGSIEYPKSDGPGLHWSFRLRSDNGESSRATVPPGRRR
jgi:GAF domain-containing protein